jgi:hypothetical protein
VVSDTKKLLRNVTHQVGGTAPPIFIILLFDEQGALGQALAKLAVLENAITENDRVRFGNLIGSHKQRMVQTIRTQVDGMIKQRRYETALKEDIEAKRLGPVGTEIFKQIYKKPLPFPFDGFSTARGNAADSCQELTIELLRGTLDYDAVLAKPVKTKNRAVIVLKESWTAFTKDGSISKRPAHPVARAITEKWDEILQSDNQRFVIGSVLRQLCLPPHGANIASAGMLLGVFVTPRIEKLVLVRNGEQYSVPQRIQDDLFRGKFLDLLSLDDVELALVGEASSEWEVLLDEWEQAENYFARIQCLGRAYKLREHVSVPPALKYHFIHLEEQGLSAREALKKMEKDQDNGFSKLHHGYERNDVSTLSWGAAILFTLEGRMTFEKPRWTDHQIAEVQPETERARQKIIQIFSEWLVRQAPLNDSPEAIGDFKHKMITNIGGSLKKLGLNTQYEELEAKTNLLIRDVEKAVEARQLVRDVRSWLEKNADVFRIVRVAEIRGLLEVGKEFAHKLQGMTQRFEMPQLAEIRSSLAEFIENLKKAESEIMKRASRLWQTKLRSGGEIDGLFDEIGDLVGTFEGCQTDLEDLRLMRSVLLTYQRAYKELINEALPWQEFESLHDRLLHEAKAAFGEEEIPWLIDKTLLCSAPGYLDTSLGNLIAKSLHIEKASVSGHLLGLANESTFYVKPLHHAAAFMK